MTDIRELTVERTLELLREVVAEFGEDHTAACQYVSDDGKYPVCIAGHVYHRAGVTIDQLKYSEGIKASAWRFTDLGIPRRSSMIALRAQTVQDSGRTWGEALAAAEEFAASLQESAA